MKLNKIKFEELIKQHVLTILENEDKYEQQNYMFFSNLEQMHRQTKYLIEENHDKIDEILKEHDWAQDHITEAKSLLDQVFDFLMNEIKGSKTDENLMESKNKPTNPKLWSQSLAWAKRRYKVCPSAYCNSAAAKRYKSKGGGWRKDK